MNLDSVRRLSFPFVNARAEPVVDRRNQRQAHRRQPVATIDVLAINAGCVSST